METVPQFLELAQQQEPGHSWLPSRPPGAQGPAQRGTQWAGRMRGTAGHPEIAPLVRNQKGNQKDGGGGGWELREQGRGEGWGWLAGRGQDVCEGDSVCVCPCDGRYCAVETNVLFPCKNKLTLHCSTFSPEPGCFQVIKVETAIVGLKADGGELI